MAGAVLRAGIGWSTVWPDIDFETFSAAGNVWDAAARKWRGPPRASQGKRGLPVVGASAYAAHPSAEVLLLSYDLKDGRGRRRWRAGQPRPEDLCAHVATGGVLEAWNAGFERWMWENCLARLGWPVPRPDQWRCAMAKARSFCLPGKLAEAARVLGSAEQKDSEGKRLIDRFTQPRNPTQVDPRLRAALVWSPEDVQAQVAAMVAAGAKPGPAMKAVLADLADSQRFADYCEQDIATEANISGVVPDMHPLEHLYWLDDQAINHRGVALDLPALESCIQIIEAALERYNGEFAALTGIDAASKLQQLLGWLHARGVHLDNLDEDAVEAALKLDLPPEARRALELRAAVGSASVKKVFAMRNALDERGRLFDLYTWHGARTGRPTGNGAQPTNLPKAGPPVLRCKACGHHHRPGLEVCPWCGVPGAPGAKPSEWSPEAAEDALHLIHTRNLDILEATMGNGMSCVAGVLRGLFAAAPGHDFISSDFSAIEGVITAALAGEQWRMDVFRGHGKIYEMSAAKVLGIAFEDMMAHAGYTDLSKPEWWKERQTGPHHPGRQVPGKVCELALGFLGWINAWKQFNGPGTDEEIKANIIAWRDASPTIPFLGGGQRMNWATYSRMVEARTGAKPDPVGWTSSEIKWGRQGMRYGLEGNALAACERPDVWFPVSRMDGSDTGIAYLKHGDALYCRLRSGRCIVYHRPRIEPAREEWRGLSLSFEGWNSNPASGPLGWQRMNTYAGKLLENVVQATARDVQMHAIHHLERRGYPVVLHTYDEVVCEVPLGFGSVEELEAIMATLPEWAAGWPIKAAGGWRAGRYRKG